MKMGSSYVLVRTAIASAMSAICACGGATSTVAPGDGGGGTLKGSGGEAQPDAGENDGGSDAGEDGGSTMTCATPAGLLAYYPLDGDTRDYSGNGYNAGGSVTFTASGRVGGAATFNGTTSAMYASGSVVLGARTFCAWALPSARSGLGQPLFSGGATNVGDFFSLSASAPATTCTQGLAANVPFLDHWGNADCDTPTGARVAPGAWHFLCLAYDDVSSVTFYIDGAATTWPGSEYTYALETLYIGSAVIGGTTTQSSFLGEIDEVTVWSRALATSDFAALWNGGAGCAAK